jgi:hypothetical protein
MKRLSLPLLTAVLFAGCATIYNPRSDPPDVVAVSAAAPAEVAGCLVRELDALSPAGASNPHHALVLSPGESYEIAPIRPIVLTGEVYLVRVDREAAGGSRLELYSLWNWVETLRPALAACGEVS